MRHTIDKLIDDTKPSVLNVEIAIENIRVSLKVSSRGDTEQSIEIFKKYCVINGIENSRRIEKKETCDLRYNSFSTL